ncbi:hypothetical protein, partial [Teredinibacter waterburyi]|uniref:hypothetical protein n=1 Tax=Teredinibacter waterburyi TaxID=1500538 RepID=UPI001CAA827C
HKRSQQKLQVSLALCVLTASRVGLVIHWCCLLLKYQLISKSLRASSVYFSNQHNSVKALPVF